MTGDDLVRFVNEKLFPQLAKFKETATETSSLEYKIGEIFSELRNKIQSGYNLREIINKIDSLKFSSADDKHEMTVLYEDKIRRMGNAGRNGGEYYTPRPLIRSIIKVVDPQIGDTMTQPAARPDSSAKHTTTCSRRKRAHPITTHSRKRPSTAKRRSRFHTSSPQ